MTSRRTWIVVFVAAALVWTASTRLNLAQSSAPAGGTKVAVVDLVRLFNEFEQTAVVNDRMREASSALTTTAEEKMKSINADRAALEAFTPDTPDWYTRRKALRERVYEYQIWEQLRKDQLNEDHLHWAKKTYQMVTDEIARVARRRGFQIVITQEEIDTNVDKWNVLYQQMLNRKVVYSEPGVDLTAEVLANLNASFDPKTVKLSD